MNKLNAIKSIINQHPGAFFILSNGLTSRIACAHLRQVNCLYLLHGMGETLAVGIGLATADPNLQVIVIDGDGNALMGLASWSMMPQPNLKYFVLRNHMHETTGGQELPEFPTLPNWVNTIEIDRDTLVTPNPPQPTQIWSHCAAWLKNRSTKDISW